jgi:LacI family transcriptional regulator
MPKPPTRPTLLLSFEGSSPDLQGIIDECNALGWRMINVRYADDYLISRQSPIGAILVDMPQRRTIPHIQRTGIPIVCTGEISSDELEPDGIVLPDRYGAGRVAAEAFVERGFKHLAFIAFGSAADSDPLGTALREVAESHGATAHLGRLDPGDALDGHGSNVRKADELTEWVKALPKPAAILAYNFKMGIRITSACESAGLSVPEEVAIACRGDNEPLHRTAPVPLSGVETNQHEIGRQAVRLMKRLVDGKPPPKEPILVPVKGFVERRSTDIFAIPDPRVAKAVRFMWDHLSWPLLVDDVAAEVGVSLNTLKRAFRRSLNCGVGAELRRKRLETAKELLRGGKKTLPQIAEAVGFASSRHLHRAFKSAFGMTPGEFRRSTRTRTAP